MSDVETPAISILLPQSSVVVFSQEEETLAAATHAANDWRFARVNITTQDSDIVGAVSYCRDHKSPDLIIIQSDTIDETLPAKLEELAGHCSESTAAIVIGPVNDVNLYRKLIDMGVSDYLVKPIDAQMMADVIAKTLVERLGVAGSRLIAFMGAKGGVGTSALTQALSWGVSEILQQKTFLLDVAGGWSSMSVGMGFEPVTTLIEAAKAAANDDEDSLNRMLFKASNTLSVLASGGGMMLENSVTSGQVEELLSMVLTKYPVLLVDLSHATPDLKRVVVSRAHQINVVSTANLSSLRLARGVIQEMKNMRGGDEGEINLLINMQGADVANEVPKADIEKAMGLEISSIIPFAPKIFGKSEGEAKRVIDDPQGKEIVSASLLSVVKKVLSLDKDMLQEKGKAKSGFLKGMLSSFKKK